MCCRVDKCCFCINLRAGVITIACIWLLGDALFLAWMSYNTYRMDASVQNLQSSGFWDLDPEDRDVFGYLVIGTFWADVLLVILYSLAVILDIMLLVGAIAVRRQLLHGWMVAYAVVYGHFLVVSALNLAVGFVYNPYTMLVSTAGTLLHVGLTVYFWIVVRSYYLTLGQQYGEGGPRSTAGKVYRTVPTGEVLPAQGTYCGAGGMAMTPTATSHYTSPA